MKTALTVVGIIVALLVIAVAYLLWPVLSQRVAHKVSEIGLTSNEIAANGPLPGDVNAYGKEVACVKKTQATGYYQSLNGAEIADAQRSGIYPCATFTGSFTGPNQVYAWRSEDHYNTTSYINNRKPGELYIAGGQAPPLTGPIPAGPFVAKADATTGKQLWRTYLENANTSGVWVANTNLNILPNGKIVEAWSNKIALLDPDTGLVLAENTLPTGPTPPINANFKHVTVAPDGTLIVKDQTRPAGCRYQGTAAILPCTMKGMRQGNSELVAVDPETLQVLDAIALPQPSTVPHTITMFEGKIAIYVGANSGGFRYFWDPVKRKLSQDASWVPSVLQKGQTTPAAPSILGDWIVFQTDGIGSKTVASSIVAVNQKDPKKVVVIFPFGQLRKGQMSLCPPKPEVDPENSMIYSADMGLGKVAGIKIDQATGQMKTAFILEDATSGFQPLYGPKNRRVLVISNFESNVPGGEILATLATQNYKEQVTWRDAETGRLLATSDFFEPMSLNGLITPGFGGRFYYMYGEGFIVLQVVPASTLPKTSEASPPARA